MTLIKCKECGKELSTKAKQCPECGAAAHKKTSMFTWIVAVVSALWLIGYISEMTDSGAVTNSEQQRVAMTPKEKAEAERKDRSRKDAEQRSMGLKWNYHETDDKMGRGKIMSAVVRSLNQIEFDFPYRGAQRATLQLRKHPKYGSDVIIAIERGQFMCRVDGCSVQAKFGNGKAERFSASEPTDHSSTVLFITNYDGFLYRARKEDKVYVEAEFYQEGHRVFEFDISGLKWP